MYVCITKYISIYVHVSKYISKYMSKYYIIKELCTSVNNLQMVNVGKDYYSDIGREEQSICENSNKTSHYPQIYDYLQQCDKVNSQ